METRFTCRKCRGIDADFSIHVLLLPMCIDFYRRVNLCAQFGESTERFFLSTTGDGMMQNPHLVRVIISGKSEKKKYSLVM